MLDTGLGPGEALSLQWRDVHHGLLHVRDGKTRYRARNVNLTTRVSAMIERRKRDSTSDFAFADGKEKPLLPTSLAQQHARVRQKLKLPREFVLLFIKAHGVDPIGRKWRRCFHHHANCWTFIGDHLTALCTSVFGDGGPGDRTA